jgi:AcrR family transcriptional regulator
MSKGEDTKHAILGVALDMASRIGLEQVTIGGLAKEAGLSKSGLYAHFQSKESLQIDILQHAGQLFVGSVLFPALRVPAGISRIQALVENWSRWNMQLSGGCIFVSASNTFQNIPGKVRDFLVAQQQEWLGSLQRLAQSAIECGDFRKDVDTRQFAYELYSFLLGFNLFYKMTQNDNPMEHQKRALERLINANC